MKYQWLSIVLSCWFVNALFVRVLMDLVLRIHDYRFYRRGAIRGPFDRKHAEKIPFLIMLGLYTLSPLLNPLFITYLVCIIPIYIYHRIRLIGLYLRLWYYKAWLFVADYISRSKQAKNDQIASSVRRVWQEINPTQTTSTPLVKCPLCQVHHVPGPC